MTYTPILEAMLLYFKTKTCIQIEHSNIKLIFITYLKKMFFIACSDAQT